MKNTMKRENGQYILSAGSIVNILLPNGDDLLIYASKKGEYTTVEVKSHDKGMNPALDVRNTGQKIFDKFTTESIGITAKDYDDNRISVEFKSFTAHPTK